MEMDLFFPRVKTRSSGLEFDKVVNPYVGSFKVHANEEAAKRA
jgi:hypothetical protein